MATKLALGFRAHSGWAAAVVVAGSPSRPIVLDRRRIIIADPAMPGSKQPFHAAERFAFSEAEAFIGQCQTNSKRLAENAIQVIAAEYPDVIGVAILVGSGRPLPELAAILKSHAYIHTAEGEFFRQVLIQACESCSLPAVPVGERQVWSRGATIFDCDPEHLKQTVKEIGRALGPPWREDEKMASMAAWISLAQT